MRRAFLVVICAGALWAADDRVKVDNEFVKIIKAVDPPHAKTPLHKHDFNRVMVYVDPCSQTIHYEDGRADTHAWKADQVAWSPAGPKHISENTGGAPCTIIEVELKQPAPAKASVRAKELDPVAIDPKHNILLFDNPQVRVFRSWREPGATEAMHEHTGRGRVVILLTDIEASVKAADGATSKMSAKARDAFWTAGPVKHAGSNVGDKRFDMILVEVK